MGGREVSAPAGRWTLVLAVLCGVIAMHALVLGHATPVSAESAPSGHTSSTSTHMWGAAAIGSRTPAPPGSTGSSGVTAGTAVDHPSGPHDDSSSTAGADASLPGGAGTGGHDPSGHDHGLLHLCLAVLAVLAGLLAVPLLARPVVPGAGVRSAHRPRTSTAAATPPPPSSVRLAQLCVLRT